MALFSANSGEQVQTEELADFDVEMKQEDNEMKGTESVEDDGRSTVSQMTDIEIEGSVSGESGDGKRRRTDASRFDKSKTTVRFARADDEPVVGWWEISDADLDWLNTNYMRGDNSEVAKNYKANWEKRFGSAAENGFLDWTHGEEVWTFLVMGMEAGLQFVRSEETVPVPKVHRALIESERKEARHGSYLTAKNQDPPGEHIRRTHKYRGEIRYGVLKGNFYYERTQRGREQVLKTIWPMMGTLSKDALYQLSVDRERQYQMDACAFCLMGRQFFKRGLEVTELMKKEKQGQHNPSFCPLVLEGRDPVGFEGNPFLYGKFHALTQHYLRRRYISKFSEANLRVRLSYTWGMDEERQDVATVMALQKHYRFPKIEDVIRDYKWDEETMAVESSGSGSFGNPKGSAQPGTAHALLSERVTKLNGQFSGGEIVFSVVANLMGTYPLEDDHVCDPTSFEKTSNFKELLLGVNMIALELVKTPPDGNSHVDPVCMMCLDEYSASCHLSEAERNGIPKEEKETVLDRAPMIWIRGRRNVPWFLLSGDNDLKEEAQWVCAYHRSCKSRAELMTGAGRFLAIGTPDGKVITDVEQGPTVTHDRCGRCKKTNFLFDTTAYAWEFAYYDWLPAPKGENWCPKSRNDKEQNPKFMRLCAKCIDDFFSHEKRTKAYCAFCNEETQKELLLMYSYTVGPACLPCVWGLIENGICPCCEKPVATSRDWIRVTDEVSIPLYFCCVCAADRECAVMGMTAQVNRPDSEYVDEPIPDTGTRRSSDRYLELYLGQLAHVMDDECAFITQGYNPKEPWLSRPVLHRENREDEPIDENGEQPPDVKSAVDIGNLSASMASLRILSEGLGMGSLATTLSETMTPESVGQLMAAIPMMRNFGAVIPSSYFEKMRQMMGTNMSMLCSRSEDDKDVLYLCVRKVSFNMLRISESKVKEMTDQERKALVEAEFAREAADLEFSKMVMLDMLTRIKNGEAPQMIADGVISINRMASGTALPDELKTALKTEDNEAIEESVRAGREELEQERLERTKAKEEGSVQVRTVEKNVDRVKMTGGTTLKPKAKGTAAKKKGASLLQSVHEEELQTQETPTWNNVTAVNGKTHCLEEAGMIFVVKTSPRMPDVLTGLLSGKAVFRQEKERALAGDEWGNELIWRRAVVIVDGEEIPVVSNEVVDRYNSHSEFREQYFAKYEKGTQGSKFGVLRSGGTKKHAGYEMPGSKCFGEFLVCGASDGADNLALESEDQPGFRYSLGRPVASGCLTGAKTKAAARGCTSEDCLSSFHHYRPGTFITKKMYLEDGLKDVKFQMYSGCQLRSGMDKFQAAHLDDFMVFHFVIRYDKDGDCDPKYKGLLTFKGACSLCNKEMELHLKEEDYLESGGGFYPEGVTDNLEHYQKVLSPMYWDEEGLLRDWLPSELLMMVEREPGKGLDNVLPHLGSAGHHEKVVKMEAINSFAGRARRGCGDRYFVDGNAREARYLEAFGQKFWFKANVGIPVPCIEAIEDFIGFDYQAATIFVLHIIRQGKLLVKLQSGAYSRVTMADVLVGSTCLMVWNETIDGERNQYDSAETIVLDTAFLPDRYEDYFKAIGVDAPTRDASSAPPTTLDEYFADNMTGSAGVPLKRSFIQELCRIKRNEQSEVRFVLDKKSRAGMFAEMAMPIANEKDKLWFGVTFRLDPTGPLLSTDEAKLFFEGRNIVVCLDQIYNWSYIEGKKGAEFHHEYFCMAWLSRGGSLGLGHGFTRRVDELVLELEKAKSLGAKLAPYEDWYLTASEEERHEVGAKYMNDVLKKKREARMDAASLLKSFAEIRGENRGSETVGDFLIGSKPVPKGLARSTSSVAPTKIDSGVAVKGTTRGNLPRVPSDSSLLRVDSSEAESSDRGWQKTRFRTIRAVGPGSGSRASSSTSRSSSSAGEQVNVNR